MMTDKELIIRLKKILIQFDNTIDWGQDCMRFAMAECDRIEYGELWRSDEAYAIEAKRDLHDLIQQLKHEGRS